MLDNGEEKSPLLSSMMDSEIERNQTVPIDNIRLRTVSSTMHCHLPDETFDYQARNRLLIVLLLCLIFMIIEIIGRLLFTNVALMNTTSKCLVRFY
jgi:hypothetical protein